MTLYRIPSRQELDDNVVYLDDVRRERAERQREHSPDEKDAALTRLYQSIADGDDDFTRDVTLARASAHLRVAAGLPPKDAA